MTVWLLFYCASPPTFISPFCWCFWQATVWWVSSKGLKCGSCSKHLEEIRVRKRKVEALETTIGCKFCHSKHRCNKNICVDIWRVFPVFLSNQSVPWTVGAFSFQKTMMMMMMMMMMMIMMMMMMMMMMMAQSMCACECPSETAFRVPPRKSPMHINFSVALSSCDFRTFLDVFIPGTFTPPQPPSFPLWLSTGCLRPKQKVRTRDAHCSGKKWR